MPILNASNLLLEAGLAAAALVSILTLLMLISRSKPVRFVFRRLVGDPTSSWLRATMKEELGDLCNRMSKVEDELKPNGGKSLRDRVEFIAGKVDQ